MKKKTDKSESFALSLGDELIADLRRLIMDARKTRCLWQRKCRRTAATFGIMETLRRLGCLWSILKFNNITLSSTEKFLIEFQMQMLYSYKESVKFKK
ncbi:MAG: hypothetical protein C4548_14845 [Desulfobacteraceae bacterium]|jgi:hypothetical protein|nr:MAG: hypothetical protein C4548_14845 [Desulfobacteraceae bacterium]